MPDARLALGDAVDLGLVQGVDLVLALRCLFEQATAQPECLQHPSEQRTFGNVLEVAAQVPSHAANIALELAQGLAHALDLPGMGIPPDLGGQSRRKPGVVLAQIDPGFFRQADQQRAGALVKPRIRGVGDGLFHHGRIHSRPLQALVGDRARSSACLDRIGQQPLHSFLPDPLAPAHQRRGIDRGTVLEERLAGEVLVIRVLDSPGDDCLVRELEGVLEIHEPRHQAWRCRWPPLVRRKEARPLPFKEIPVDQCRKLHQLMAGVDHVDQSRAEQVILFRGAGMGPHRRPEIAGFMAKAYETLQFKANKTAASAHKINALSVVRPDLLKGTSKNCPARVAAV